MFNMINRNNKQKMPTNESQKIHLFSCFVITCQKKHITLSDYDQLSNNTKVLDTTADQKRQWEKHCYKDEKDIVYVTHYPLLS